MPYNYIYNCGSRERERTRAIQPQAISKNQGGHHSSSPKPRKIRENLSRNQVVPSIPNSPSHRLDHHLEPPSHRVEIP